MAKSVYELLGELGFETVLMRPSSVDPRKAIILYENSDGKLEVAPVQAGESTTVFEDVETLVEWLNDKIEESEQEGQSIIIKP